MAASAVISSAQPANAAPGDVITLAGNGTPSFADGTGGATGTAQFFTPRSVAVDSSGNVFVADGDNNRIRKVNSATGLTTTLAGNGTGGFVDGTGGAAGTTQFNIPTGVAVDSSGNVYVVDGGNYRVRKVDGTTGATITLAGNGTAGFVDGTGGTTGTTQFRDPAGIAVDNF